MESHSVTRKLTAIFSADVQGYSRLMGEDEEQTVRTLTAYREVMTTLIQQHRGRVVDSPGDNLLAEFASVVDGLRCAVAVQQELQVRNAQLSSHRQMKFRIGLNLGDVIVEGERLYGDGVNIAARLEGLAEGGGICISGAVYDQVENKLPLEYQYLGEREVKNITKPVRVYQVLAPLTSTQPVTSSQHSVVSSEEQSSVQRLESRVQSQISSPAPGPRPLTPSLVGREDELAQLHHWLGRALDGERRVVFLSGEAGIGKTTLADVFVAQIATQHDLWVTWGQCVEQYGAGEAYLPILEALSRLGREAGREDVITVLARYAPTWLAQLPALVNMSEREALQRTLLSATKERMLREVAEAIETLTARRPLIIVLEDLHWSDVSTLEVIAYLARRRGLARLLFIVTYRPTEVLASEHPLKGVVQELLGRGHCEELRLGLLQKAEVSSYVRRRFGNSPLPEELVELLYQHTSGNPLFMVNIVEHLLREGMIVEEGGQWAVKQEIASLDVVIPDSLRQLIEKQLEELSADEQRILEVASVAGSEFAVATVAAGAEQDVEVIEGLCEGLAVKGQFVRAAGIEEWPDGTLSGRYQFIHGLHQHVAYERIAEARRIQLHRRLGVRKEEGYGQRTGEIASELAAHFEAGRDSWRAVRYRSRAGANAARRHAHQEAIQHFSRALTLLYTFPDSPERTQEEIRLQIALGGSLIASRGYAAPEVEQAYARALELCRQEGETPRLFSTLWGLFGFYLVRADLQTARGLGEQLMRLAQESQDPRLLLGASFVTGQTLFHLGEFVSAQAHLEKATGLYDSLGHRFDVFRTVQDSGVASLSYTAFALWVMGYPDQALERVYAALTLAQDLSHPFSLAWALSYVAAVHRLRWERQATREQAEQVIHLSKDQGFPQWLSMGTMLLGWALSEQEAGKERIAQIRQSLVTWRTLGAELSRSNLLALLAEVYAEEGEPEEGLRTIEEALAVMNHTGEWWYEAELYRLKGTLTLQSKVQGQESPKSEVRSPESEAEECFLKAIEVARRQNAKSWELRATVSLARLWQQQGKHSEAHNMLSEIYGWFTEGFDTKDLQEAEALLCALGSQTERKQNGVAWMEPFDLAQDRLGAIQEATPTAVLTSVRSERTLSPELVEGSKGKSKTEGLDASAGDARADKLPVAPPAESIHRSSFSVPRSAEAHSTPSTEPRAPNPEHRTPSTFRNEGEYWTLAFQGVLCRVKDTRGMQYLAQLLQHPHHEFHAVALATGSADLGVVPSLGAATLREVDDRADSASTVGGFTDAGEVLDPQAKAAYKQRLQELQAELEEAQAFNDPGRAEKLREEIDFLTQELVQAVGLGGRARKAASPVERARVNVTRAIRTAITKITDSHPALGQYLAQTIKTGTFCTYIPEPNLSVDWQF